MALRAGVGNRTARLRPPEHRSSRLKPSGSGWRNQRDGSSNEACHRVRERDTGVPGTPYLIPRRNKLRTELQVPQDATRVLLQSAGKVSSPGGPGLVRVHRCLLRFSFLGASLENVRRPAKPATPADCFTWFFPLHDPHACFRRPGPGFSPVRKSGRAVSYTEHSGVRSLRLVPGVPWQFDVGGRNHETHERRGKRPGGFSTADGHRPGFGLAD